MTDFPEEVDPEIFAFNNHFDSFGCCLCSENLFILNVCKLVEDFFEHVATQKAGACDPRSI